MISFLNCSAATLALSLIANAAAAQTAPEAVPPAAMTDPVAGPPAGSPPAPEMATASAPLPADELEQPKHPNRPLLITGGVLLAASYGASAIVAGASDRDSNDRLFYPVVGPWLALHDMDCDETACKREGLYKALLIGDGVVQGAGVVALLLGAVLPESRKKPWYLIGSEKLQVAPQFGASTLGLTAAGKF